jgi:hypothetical protein
VRRTFAVGLIVLGLGAGGARVALVQESPRPSPRAEIYAVERDQADPQSNTQVEPDSSAWGKKIVAAFQDWRIFDGGAAALGWATSGNAGTGWRSGTLALGEYTAATDPVVAFDAAHHTWLIAGIGFRGAYDEIFVARSPDGLKWAAPLVIASNTDEGYDKEWLDCDNGARSQFRGRCYLAYVDIQHWVLGIRTSDDGGATWTKPIHLQPDATSSAFSGPVPVTRPNGDLVVPYSFFGPPNGDDHLAAVVSHDGGATFSQPIRIASLEDADALQAIRAPALPSVAVDAAGRLFVAWQDGRFRANAGVSDIVLSTSPNGVGWTEPARIPLSSARAYFLPAIAVDPATSGKTAHVAVAYYSMRMSARCAVFKPGCHQEIDAWLVQSKNGGRTWTPARQLNGQPMQIEWLADTSLGPMLGDYISVSYVHGKPVPVIALASPPSAAGLSESIVTCRLDGPAPRSETQVSSLCRRPSP